MVFYKELRINRGHDVFTINPVAMFLGISVERKEIETIFLLRWS